MRCETAVLAFLLLEVLHFWLEYFLIKFLLLVTGVAVVSYLFHGKSRFGKGWVNVRNHDRIQKFTESSPV
jgi:hypothetical protein